MKSMALVEKRRPLVVTSDPMSEQYMTAIGLIIIKIWLWINTYENTIFRGMNIHFNPAILMWTKGVQGFDTLPYGGFHKWRISNVVGEKSGKYYENEWVMNRQQVISYYWLLGLTKNQLFDLFGGFFMFLVHFSNISKSGGYSRRKVRSQPVSFPKIDIIFV